MGLSAKRLTLDSHNSTRLRYSVPTLPPGSLGSHDSEGNTHKTGRSRGVGISWSDDRPQNLRTGHSRGTPLQGHVNGSTRCRRRAIDRFCTPVGARSGRSCRDRRSGTHRCSGPRGVRDRCVGRRSSTHCPGCSAVSGALGRNESHICFGDEHVIAGLVVFGRIERLDVVIAGPGQTVARLHTGQPHGRDSVDSGVGVGVGAPRFPRGVWRDLGVPVDRCALRDLHDRPDDQTDRPYEREKQDRIANGSL